MLEKAKEVTMAKGKYTEIEYVRFADDIAIAVSSHPSMNGLLEKNNNAIERRIRKTESQNK